MSKNLKKNKKIGTSFCNKNDYPKMINPLDNQEHIYIFQPREHVRMKEPVYKIGRTSREILKRYKEYPDETIIYFSMQVKDSKNIEKLAKIEFANKFKVTRFGTEYFEGNITDMIQEITKIIFDNDDKTSVFDEINQIIRDKDAIIKKLQQQIDVFIERYGDKFCTIHKEIKDETNERNHKCGCENKKFKNDPNLGYTG